MAHPTHRPRILVVEDEAIVARDIQLQLASLGYEPVGHAKRGEEAVLLTGELLPDLVLMDIQLAGAMNGVEAATLVRQRHSIPVVFLTAFAEDTTLEQAKLAEPFGYVLKPYAERELRIVLEHITTRDAAQFVADASPKVAATITAHHLLLDRNDMLAGGIRPHLYCLPILKRGTHREALVAAATSGNPKYFLGTDSAPHARPTKETACGCAGVYTAHAALELYAEVFEQAGALDKLEAFASFHGPDHYKLPRNNDRITLTRRQWPVPDAFPFDGDTLVPLRAGSAVEWAVAAVPLATKV